MKRPIAIAALLVTMCAAATASAQVVQDKPIVYGHFHFRVTDVDAHRRFWVDTLGGTTAPFGTLPDLLVKIPNVIILIGKATPSGGARGTIVKSIGFQVPNLRTMVEKLKAAGYPIVTSAEMPGKYTVKDGIAFSPDEKASIAFTLAPDDTPVEFVENTKMTQPIALHNVHFLAPNVAEMKAWYVKTFGAVPTMHGTFEAADLPGASLRFSAAPRAVLPTKGRVLDHIGFEITGLENFTMKLQSSGTKLDRPFAKFGPTGAVPNLGYAFVTDPWGTQIEINEGLVQF